MDFTRFRPQPAMAWVERDGELVQVDSSEVRIGESVTIGVGETIPVDGWIQDGAALVNQASVTGEGVPVRQEAPGRVIAGSVLVEGRLRVEATQVGEDTTTARIARFIQDSLNRKADTQRLADRLGDQRVYLTLGTGAAVYALTRDLTPILAGQRPQGPSASRRLLLHRSVRISASFDVQAEQGQGAGQFP